jgi:hypothetical protein
MLTQQDITHTEPEQIEVEITPQEFSYSGITWRQEGYELIGIHSNGIRFGLKIDPNLRLCGVSEDNKPIFKRIDM